MWVRIPTATSRSGKPSTTHRPTYITTTSYGGFHQHYVNNIIIITTVGADRESGPAGMQYDCWLSASKRGREACIANYSLSFSR